ncbi:hypothetical protein HJG60_011860 [Phyllostomus discolor]|uniref:Uncharacterized protein n=1 Tax=Phyllostomus discolor TaxID=89673 RepID=A0A834DYE3_9CHIR|nr:hypothetical protein HJG60_011860 [Phyllostomus discolor]
MKLFTKETLTHPSLYWLGLARRDRGRLGLGGEGRVFFFFLECASPARPPSKEGKGEQRDRCRQAHCTDTGGPPALTLSSKETEVSSARTWAQTLHKETLYVKQYFNTVMCLFPFPFSFLFNQKKKKLSKLTHKEIWIKPTPLGKQP